MLRIRRKGPNFKITQSPGFGRTMTFMGTLPRNVLLGCNRHRHSFTNRNVVRRHLPSTPPLPIKICGRSTGFTTPLNLSRERGPRGAPLIFMRPNFNRQRMLNNSNRTLLNGINNKRGTVNRNNKSMPSLRRNNTVLNLVKTRARNYRSYLERP